MAPWRISGNGELGAFARRHRLSARGAGYSWFVRGAKYALPVAALVIAGLVLSRLLHDPFHEQLAQLPGEERTLPGQSALEGARYEGADTQGRPFVLRAEKALRVLPPDASATDLAPAQGETVDLVHPSASMTLSDARSLSLDARAGRFVQDDAVLDLTGGVTLTDQAGNALWLDSVNVNLQDNALSSDAPVRGQGPDGTIDAQGLRLENGGEKIIFTGRATLTLPTVKKGETK